MGSDDKKSILFVDDEPRILSSIRRLLRREGWELLFATSGRAGLAALEEHDVDLVVSDMLMAEMDGATFLREVKEAHPNTIRVILTGYPDSEMVARAFAEADIQQIIPKPWEGDELKDIIRNALEQSASQDEEIEGLHEIINKIDALPSLPHVYTELRAAIQDAESSSAETVAEIIMQDAAMAAKILQVANSAFFGQRRQVETINRAVVLLGMQMVENLVLSTSVFQSLEADEIEGFSAEDFWQHSMACSGAARAIEGERSRDRERLEKVMLAGILHDLGKLVFARFMPDQYAEVVSAARDGQSSMAELEKELLGASHAAVGGYLANWWNLPAQVAAAIRWHHEPAQSREDPSFVATIHVANVLVHRLQVGASGTCATPDIDPSALEALEMDEGRLADIEAEVKDTVDQGAPAS